MKKNCLLIIAIVLSCISMFADRRPVVIQNGGSGGSHFEFPAISDMPDAVYYDSDEMEIIIEADGVSQYYDVEIVSDSLNQTVILTQVSGYGDTIDVSSLPTGSYTIIFTSQFHNTYEGQFYI